MIKFDTIDLLTGGVFQVTWDLGRRCNYDCSYCPAHRHDNFSPHASLDELKKNVDFVLEYVNTYMRYRDYKMCNIGFTGGEPTVNPNFIEFVRYLKHAYETRYRDKWAVGFSLTTNGAMSEKMATAVMENLNHATVSYHAESSPKLKQQVKDRIMQFSRIGKPKGFTMNINVMFHAAYFDECKELCAWLDEKNIAYVPRIIGEEPDSKSNFAHSYTPDQLDYIKNYWKYKNAELDKEKEVAYNLSAVNAKKEIGNTIGRPCCGQREMCLSNSFQEKKTTFVHNREFEGWFCSVNWFFLHIEQQTDSVYHHQTCQARFDKTRGPIGKLSEGEKILKDLKTKLEKNEMPTIVCPKKTCGCGLCAPKSRTKEGYMKSVSNHISTGPISALP